MPTTAPKEKHCAFAVGHLVVGAISIVRQKSNAAGVRKRSFAPQVPVGDYLSIGRSQRDKTVRALAGTPDYKRSQRARYKVETLFAELGRILSFPQWSSDGRSIYYWVGGSERALYRIRTEDYRTEKVLDMSGIAHTGTQGSWGAVDPQGNPLILRAILLSEIYALDVDLP